MTAALVERCHRFSLADKVGGRWTAGPFDPLEAMATYARLAAQRRDGEQR